MFHVEQLAVTRIHHVCELTGIDGGDEHLGRALLQPCGQQTTFVDIQFRGKIIN